MAAAVAVAFGQLVVPHVVAAPRVAVLCAVADLHVVAGLAVDACASDEAVPESAALVVALDSAAPGAAALDGVDEAEPVEAVVVLAFEALEAAEHEAD